MKPKTEPLHTAVGEHRAMEVHKGSADLGTKTVYKGYDADTGEQIGPYHPSRAKAKEYAEEYVGNKKRD